MHERPATARRGAAVAVVVAGAALAVVTGLVLVAGGRSSAGPAAERLPDLVQRAPYGLSVATVRTSDRPRFQLGFASAVENVGAGPLAIVGRRNESARTMTARQVVARSGGSSRSVDRVGVLRYTVETTHEHWHLLAFERYELRRARDGRRVRRDRKTGFCLGDRYDAFPAKRLAGEPAQPVWTQECGRDRPDLLTVREGISVGFGDDYDAHVEGQFVDVTDLSSGRYELVHRVNPDRRLRESRYGNNAASIVIELSWPRGRSAAPRATVVARCGDGQRCRRRG